ncbi:hypothetical protein MNBD_ALPHA04-2230 [hydrothermal vent metagenome]|uniref:Peptidoglycan binding-like domain-containing protein n=1 Tax=hydrothermal vent metagenome TaxID=652676 RepID=A0A3B0RTW4_9ZZZZ
MNIKGTTGLLGLILWAAISTTSHAKEIPLRLSEMKDLFIGNTLTMERKGTTTLQYTDGNGDVTQELSARESKTGGWEIKGSRNPRICYDFPNDDKIKCFVVRKDELDDTYIIYSYRNKRAAKRLYRVTKVQPGNHLVSYRAAPKIEETVRLTRSEVRQVQAALNRRGFRAGAVDGAMGNQTRTAIAEYQRFISQPETGELTEDQLDRLLN